MAQKLKLELVTPSRMLLQVQADEVIVPAYDGFRGIRPGHEPLVLQLKTGALSYTQDNRTHSLVIGTGLLEVRNDVVNVVVEKASRPEEIDKAAFSAIRQKASDRLHKGGPDVNYDQTQAELEAAQAYLDVAKQ